LSEDRRTATTAYRHRKLVGGDIVTSAKHVKCKSFSSIKKTPGQSLIIYIIHTYYIYIQQRSLLLFGSKKADHACRVLGGGGSDREGLIDNANSRWKKARAGACAYYIIYIHIRIYVIPIHIIYIIYCIYYIHYTSLHDVRWA